MKKPFAIAACVVSVVAAAALVGMQAPGGESTLAQLVAQLTARLDALSARVNAMASGGGGGGGGGMAQQVVASQGPQRGPQRTMVVDNVQTSNHNDDNSDEIHQLEIEINSLQKTVNSTQDSLDQTVGTPVNTQENMGGEVSNRSDIDRQIGAQREQVERYASLLGAKTQRLQQLQAAENQPKQILHGHDGQVLIMLQSKFNISGQIANVVPGDTVTWVGKFVDGDDTHQIWMVDIVKEVQQ